MHAFDTHTRAVACRSCGAYGNSQHGFSCQQGRRVMQGRMRRAARGQRTSATVVTQMRLQDSLVRRV